MNTQNVRRDAEDELHDFCAEYYADPLAWVRGALLVY